MNNMDARKVKDRSKNYSLIIQTMQFTNSIRLTPKQIQRKMKQLTLTYWPQEGVDEFGEINCVNRISSVRSNTTYAIAGNKKSAVVTKQRNQVNLIQSREHHQVILNMCTIGAFKIYHYLGDPLMVYCGDSPVLVSNHLSIIALSPSNMATSCKSVLYKDRDYYFLSNMYKLIKIDLMTVTESKIANDVDDFCLTSEDKFFVLSYTSTAFWMSMNGSLLSKLMAVDKEQFRCLGSVKEFSVICTYDQSVNTYTLRMYSPANNQMVSEVRVQDCPIERSAKYLKTIELTHLSLVFACRAVAFIDIFMVVKSRFTLLRKDLRIAQAQSADINGIINLTRSKQVKSFELMIYGYKFITNIKIGN